MRCYFLAFVLGSAAKRAISIMKLGEAAFVCEEYITLNIESFDNQTLGKD